jgi:hypothetical protein
MIQLKNKCLDKIPFKFVLKYNSCHKPIIKEKMSAWEGIAFQLVKNFQAS